MTEASDGMAEKFPLGLRARFTLVYVTLFLPFAVATPYLQVLLRKRGFEKDAIGLILGTLEVMAVVAPPVWGWLSDKTRKPRLLLALATMGCIPSFFMFGSVNGVVVALAAAVLFGMCYRPLIPMTDGITFRHIKSRGGDYGSVRIGGSLAFMGATLMLERLGIAKSATGRIIIFAMLGACVLHLLGTLLLPRESMVGGDRHGRRSARARGCGSFSPGGSFYSCCALSSGGWR